MAAYLRDQKVANVRIDESAIQQIHAVFSSRVATIPPAAGAQAIPPGPFLSYVVRFDGKGYRVHNLELLLHLFRQAKSVERIIFSLETEASLRTTRNVGSYMELRLDVDASTCFAVVSADDADWVDAAYAAVVETLGKFGTRNAWAHSPWTQLVLQITGVSVGFALSLWAADQTAPNLAIENAFLIAFLFFLIVFSNTWGFLNAQTLGLISRFFPNVEFYRKDRDRLHWLAQAVIGGVALAITLFLLAQVMTYLGRVLGRFVNP
jgi:hypothetical protein